MYIVQASPLTRIYMTEWHHALLEDPELIFKSDPPFTVTIPRSAGAVVLTHNKPVHVSTLIPVTGKRKLDEAGSETRDLTHWLLEGRDTNIYGVVGIEIGSDIMDTLSLLVSMDAEAAAEAIAKAQAEMVGKIRLQLVSAREKADERVKEAMRTTHRNLQKQWKEMESLGMGKYDPSASEAVGAFVLSAEISKVATTDKRKQQLMDGAMKAMGATIGGAEGVRAQAAKGKGKLAAPQTSGV